MVYSLKNKLALITGATSNIGFLVSRLFAQHGANLALVDIHPGVNQGAMDLYKEHQGKIMITPHVFDLTRSQGVNDLFETILQRHSNQVPSIIVNAAGADLGQSSRLTEVEEKDLDRVLSVNLKATYLVTQAAVKHLLKDFKNQEFKSKMESYASIINIGSLVSKFGMAGYTHVAMGKSGLVGFTKSISKELSEYRIRCNLVEPFLVASPPPAGTETGGGINKMDIELYSSMSALKLRGMESEEVAQVVLFLASDASSYINGSIIEVSGGF